MSKPSTRNRKPRPGDTMQQQLVQNIQYGQGKAPASPRRAGVELSRIVQFLTDLMGEIDASLEPNTANPHLNMILHLLNCHVEGKAVSASSMTASSGVPYATAVRKLGDILDAGLIEQRPRTKSGKSFSLHPSQKLLGRFKQLADRVDRLGVQSFDAARPVQATEDYYFGGSYLAARSMIPLPHVLQAPLKLSGGLRILVHGDPTFMVMDNLKRQFEQIIGVDIHQRAFSIDRLREEALRNAERSKSRYDLIALDLPWLGEFVKKGLVHPLPQIMDVARLDPSDFHTAGWRAAHWDGVPYAVPSQTTPELMFHRTDLFAEAGLEPPTTTADVIDAARHFHDSRNGHYGIAWNAARGTALGHTFMMTCAAFGQPVIDLPEAVGGYDANRLEGRAFRPLLDSDGARQAADYLIQLMQYSPPDILSMSWYERVRPFASGKVAMAYGYTLLAPYFDLDRTCPAHGKTGFLPHPRGPQGAPIAPVGGYVLAVPTNLAQDRIASAVEALIVFTSPAAQKLYAQNGSRTSPRYSVGADPEVRRLSTIFEAVDQMSWRDELQFWPRPPIPQISEIIRICGYELHDMLRGVVSPAEALARAQAQAEEIMNTAIAQGG